MNESKVVKKEKAIPQEQLQKKLQEKYMEYQMLEEQTKKVQEQLETFEKQIQELATIQEAVKTLEKTKEGTELFVPISSGIFVKASIKDTSELLVNVGDNVVVEKNVQDTIKLIKKQQIEIEEYKQKVTENAQMLAAHSQRIEQEVMALAENVESK